MMKGSSVILHHIFDVSDNITLREKSCMQGMGLRSGHIPLSSDHMKVQ